MGNWISNIQPKLQDDLELLKAIAEISYNEGIYKKIMYVLSMVMASSLFAMQENDLADEMATISLATAAGNDLELNGDGQLAITIPAINYVIDSKLPGTQYSLKICGVTKDAQVISAEYLIDLMSGNEAKRYIMKTIEGATYIVPTAKHFVCICSPENNNYFFVTREFSVKNGGTFAAEGSFPFA